MEQPEPVADITHLNEQFDRLSEEQLRALIAATYIGMTSREAKIYNDRRRKIREVARRLTVLHRPQEN